MEFRHVIALRGPNYWSNDPVIEALVDLGKLSQRSSAEMPGFNERLKGWLPSLMRHRCSVGEPGGFFQRLDRGTYLAHILEHVSLELQTLAGSYCTFGRARFAGPEGVYRVAIEYEEEELGRAALETGRRVCLAAVHDTPIDVAAEIERLRNLNYEVRLGPSTQAIVAAARARRIPVERLNRQSLVQFGHGSKLRRIWTAETDRTSALAESIAQDKQLTRSMLRVVGVPVPLGRPVADEDDAWRAAQEIGLPVVVKPQYGNHGRGVATNLSTREQVAAAYRAAREEGRNILVEQFAPGDDHRLLVIGHRLVAAARREPAHVVGDGRQTIAELVSEVNRDPRRSDGHSTVLSIIKLDTIGLAVVAEQGYTPDSVPPQGTKVLIRRNGNLSTGGTATDVTDEVHPEVAAYAVDAARVVGLDIAGVDIVACDIRRPLAEQRGMIVEVNAGPGLRMHVDPTLGKPRPVGEAVVEMLFPQGENGRIPIIGVAGTSGATETCRLAARLLGTDGKTVGLASGEGVWAGARRIDADTSCGPEGARMLLMNPVVDALVVEATAAGIVQSGLGYDRGTVGVVTEVDDRPLSDVPGAEEMERRVRIFSTVPDAARRTGIAVLNADDPSVAVLSKRSAAIIYFSRDRENQRVAEHAGSQGRAVVAGEGGLIFLDGPRQDRVALKGLGSSSAEKADAAKLLPILAAAAAVWGAGMGVDELRDRLPQCLGELAVAATA